MGSYAQAMIRHNNMYGSNDGFRNNYIATVPFQPGFAADDTSDMAEAEIAACVDNWLKFHRWNTFPEVQLKHRSKRPDLVAVKGAFVQVIECKKALGLPVLEQAMSWFFPYHNPKSGLPHHIIIACRKSNGRKDFPLMLMKQYGLGFIEIEKRPAIYIGEGKTREQVSSHFYSLRVVLEPTLVPGSRKTSRLLQTQLNSDMCFAVPGTTGTGQFMTDWKRTVLKIESLMKDGQRRTVQEIVEWLTVNGGYHWSNRSSAESGINAALQRQAYGKEPYGFQDCHNRWFWDEEKTKSVIRVPVR